MPEEFNKNIRKNTLAEAMTGWTTEKDIINKNKVASTPPEYFDFNGERVTDKNKIVNGLNLEGNTSEEGETDFNWLF